MKYKILLILLFIIPMEIFSLTSININSQIQKINISPFAEQLLSIEGRNSISEGYTRDDVKKDLFLNLKS